MKVEPPYNPLDKRNLGVSVADAMLERKPVPLPIEESFTGAGIYAIYYTGDFPAYHEITKRNRKNNFAWPIYVGKAIPAGARQGGVGLGENPGTVLFGRIREHASSIQQAMTTLEIADFACRYLVVEDIWIPLGESLLIQKFEPVWNLFLDGFGNHDPGSGRYNQQRSAWDFLHPGRAWALKCAANKRTEAEILASLEVYISKKITEGR